MSLIYVALLSHTQIKRKQQQRKDRLSQPPHLKLKRHQVMKILLNINKPIVRLSTAPEEADRSMHTSRQRVDGCHEIRTNKARMLRRIWSSNPANTKILNFHSNMRMLKTDERRGEQQSAQLTSGGETT